MSSLREFRCEICGRVTTNPQRWFLIECGASRLTVVRWEAESASIPGTRHLCGEADARFTSAPGSSHFARRPAPITRSCPAGSRIAPASDFGSQSYPATPVPPRRERQ
jgi:hypothetical protein